MSWITSLSCLHQWSSLLFSKVPFVSMYVDETGSYHALEYVSEINQAANADLEALKGWLEANKLSLNIAKTKAIIIGNNGKLRKI